METKSKYFSEYEFFIDEGSAYWFPVILDCENIEQARELNIQIANLLEEQFKLINRDGVLVYREPMYSEALRKQVEEKKRAEILRVNLGHLKFSDFEKGLVIRFNQHIVMVPLNLLLYYKHLVEFNLDKLSFLTTQFDGEVNYDKDFLVVKIY